MSDTAGTNEYWIAIVLYDNASGDPACQVVGDEDGGSAVFNSLTEINEYRQLSPLRAATWFGFDIQHGEAQEL